MAHFGKSIRIYMPDGVPTGIRHAELVNWTAQAMACPRARIGQLRDWPESQRPGVYLLFGDDSNSSKPKLYVGEAENVLKRLREHVKKKEFWQEAVFFSSKDDNLTKAHVKYLEPRILQIAKQTGRVVLDNGNVPSLPALPRPDLDAMEEFLGCIQLLLGSLGFTALQPLLHPSTESDTNTSGPLADTRLHFKVEKHGVVSVGSATDEGFIVFAGSIGSATMMSSLGKGTKALRDDLLTDGRLVANGSVVEFTEDVLFNSPSAAADLISGSARNGRLVWKTAEGVSLKELEEQLANEA